MIAVSRWGGFFDYDSKKHDLELLEEKTLDPTFWNDSKKAEKILNEVKQIKSWTFSFDELSKQIDDLNTLYEFFKSGDATEEETENEFQLTLGDIYKWGKYNSNGHLVQKQPWAHKVNIERFGPFQKCFFFV